MTTLGDTLVLGLGRSGRAVATYLAGLVSSGEAGSVTACDAADNDALRGHAGELEQLGVKVVLGTGDVAGQYDVCVASPGVSPHTPMMRSARLASRRVISEIEFAFSRSGLPWVAVTGTNGKTTTTALIAHLLRVGGVRAEAVGNIGFAATDALALTDVEVLVAEVSSFQLALTETFHPKVAVLLNITPDHTDWHGSLATYIADKALVFANMGEDDLAIIDVDDSGSAPFAKSVQREGIPVVRVSLASAHAGGASCADGLLVLESEGGPIRLVRADELLIYGAHNVSNALAAAAAAHALGVAAADLREGLRTFEPIAHRLEPAGELGGVSWFDDSKATNPDAVFKALHAFGDRPVVVLLGGRNKGNDFRPLAEEVCRTAKAAVLFGESRGELADAFSGLDFPVAEATTLGGAVAAAASLAQPGDAVVLSPACASFDEFSSFEHRGDEFKRLVAMVTGGEG
jgi:UDP-N-acetylmuramoylalanine--D-glutamate ligase